MTDGVSFYNIVTYFYELGHTNFIQNSNAFILDRWSK